MVRVNLTQEIIKEVDKFNYDNQNHTRKNGDFNNQKRMAHSYDKHAEKCFGMKEDRNKENLKTFEGKVRDFLESPNTLKSNQTPAYIYKENYR
jgi:hypothetical protein